MSDDQRKPAPTGSLQGRDLEREYIFYDGQGDQVRVLNRTARSIYLLCDGTRTIVQIAEVIAEEFDVDRETALRDAQGLIDELIELGLLTLR